MIAKSDAASIFRDTRDSGSIEISVPGAFTAVGFSGQQKNPGASAAERGRPSLFKTIDEDRRETHDHINRSGRSTYPGRISVLTSGATPLNARCKLPRQQRKLENKYGSGCYDDSKGRLPEPCDEIDIVHDCVLRWLN